MRRPDPKNWILIALLAVVVNGCNGRDEPPGAGVTMPLSTNTTACPKGSVVAVELAAWKQAIEGMAHWPIDEEEPEKYPDIAPDYEALLGELGLRPLPDRTMEELTPAQGVMSLVAVDITSLRRGGGEVPDMLVAIQFRNAAGAETLRALVLRPLAGTENSYCSLGDESVTRKRKWRTTLHRGALGVCAQLECREPGCARPRCHQGAGRRWLVRSWHASR